MYEELLDLERRFWEASSARDGAFYRANVTEDALFVFPGAAGAWTREECAKAVEENDPPWAMFEIQQPRFVHLADGVVLLTYVSRSQHTGEDPFSMLISTVYRVADDEWKLAHHQQTMAASD